jgi:protein-S-isoprenylcysteine O-methyltransferase Ste14
MSETLKGPLHNVAIRRFLFRTRHLLALVLLVPLARFMKPEWLPIGFAVSLVGQAIQVWCLSSLVKNLELTVRGPYLLVRNPMYLGRYFLLLGFVLLLGNLWAVVGFTVGYWLYMTSRVKREERRLARNFGERFAAYCSQVRRFLPSLRAAEGEVWVFERRLFFENHAHWNVLGTLAAYAVLYLVGRQV